MIPFLVVVSRIKFYGIGPMLGQMLAGIPTVSGEIFVDFGFLIRIDEC